MGTRKYQIGVTTRTVKKIRPNGRRYWWPVIGLSLSIGALVWVFFLVDLDRLLVTLKRADLPYLLLLPLTTAVEQLFRAWKWRQLLLPLRRIATLRLFGAIMAGYLANILVPLGISPLVRSWLVARLDALKMSTVLATAAVDRLIDGVVFAGLVALVVVFAVFPDPDGNLRLGLALGGIGSVLLLPLLLLALIRYRHQIKKGTDRQNGLLQKLLGRLPVRTRERTKAVFRAFAEGIVWPQELWRRLGILAASIIIKLIAATNFLWAGLAFGVLLRPLDYLFLVVFLGFLIILTRFARIPGGFIVGGIFALGLLGVGKEEALAMVTIVSLASMLTIAVVGAISLWRNGISLGELQTRN